MNLFQRLPYASEVVFRWMADEREMFQLCGFLLMARLLMKGEKLNERAEAEFLDQACTAVEGDCGPVQKAASVALRKYAHQSRDNKRTVSKQLGIWQNRRSRLSGHWQKILRQIWNSDVLEIPD